MLAVFFIHEGICNSELLDWLKVVIINNSDNSTTKVAATNFIFLTCVISSSHHDFSYCSNDLALLLLTNHLAKSVLMSFQYMQVYQNSQALQTRLLIHLGIACLQVQPL